MGAETVLMIRSKVFVSWVKVSGLLVGWLGVGAEPKTVVAFRQGLRQHHHLRT